MTGGTCRTVDPTSGGTDPGTLGAEQRCRTPSSQPPAPDVQARVPARQIALSRVGVTGVEKVIRIRQNGSEQLFYAKLECFVDLGPDQKGAHMSRFEEVVNEAIGEVVLGEASFRAETLAQQIAELVRDRQGARRAEVTIAARYPEHKPAPVSGINTQEIYTLFGSAVASERGTRRLVGVAAAGLTACPCAQELISASARASASGEDGFAESRRSSGSSRSCRSRRTTSAAWGRSTSARPRERPRGRGAHAAGDRRAVDVVGDLRADEADRRGRRRREGPPAAAVRRGLRPGDDQRRGRGVPELGDDAFVSARQENLETIHQHNVQAERHGLLGELRHELGRRRAAARHTTCEEWLEG